VRRHEQGNDWNIDVIPEIDLQNGATVEYVDINRKEKAAKNCSCRRTSGQASQVFSRAFSIPVLPIDNGTILYDRLASATRHDGSSGHAHYSGKVGKKDLERFK
jgi:hypothetical protein